MAIPAHEFDSCADFSFSPTIVLKLTMPEIGRLIHHSIILESAVVSQRVKKVGGEARGKASKAQA